MESFFAVFIIITICVFVGTMSMILKNRDKLDEILELLKKDRESDKKQLVDN